MDDVAPQHTTGTLREVVARWWPVAVAVIATVVYPLSGVLFSLIMAWIRRWDRTVMLALLAVAVLAVIYTVVYVSANSGVVG